MKQRRVGGANLTIYFVWPKSINRILYIGKIIIQILHLFCIPRFLFWPLNFQKPHATNSSDMVRCKYISFGQLLRDGLQNRRNYEKPLASNDFMFLLEPRWQKKTDRDNIYISVTPLLDKVKYTSFIPVAVAWPEETRQSKMSW